MGATFTKTFRGNIISLVVRSNFPSLKYSEMMTLSSVFMAAHRGRDFQKHKMWTLLCPH